MSFNTVNAYKLTKSDLWIKLCSLAVLIKKCLFAMIGIVALCRADELPVMVWVHGGGYIFGSGSFYNPEDLIMYGPVIMVTVNYRLGPIGFLSTGKS